LSAYVRVDAPKISGLVDPGLGVSDTDVYMMAEYLVEICVSEYVDDAYEGASELFYAAGGDWRYDDPILEADETNTGYVMLLKMYIDDPGRGYSNILYTLTSKWTAETNADGGTTYWLHSWENIN